MSGAAKNSGRASSPATASDGCWRHEQGRRREPASRQVRPGRALHAAARAVRRAGFRTDRLLRLFDQPRTAGQGRRAAPADGDPGAGPPVGRDPGERRARCPAAGQPSPAAAGAGGDQRGRASAESGVDALFASLLATRSDYFQIRLISAQDHGMERVRIDRDSTLLLQVAGDDLQEKGHYPYVFETLRLPPDKFYTSPPAINHEEGAHAGLGRPSMHLAMPIHDAGRVLGLVVINIDLERIFKQLSADLPPEITLMLAGRHGDFLVHPDPAQ